ncbi:MAG: hypothetical protein ACMG57_01810 [Candidatus Dojkabacteria bacterium]
MSNSAFTKRFKEVLGKRNIELSEASFDRETIDDVCEDLGINVLEKAFIVGLDPRLIFSEGFLKGISFLELNRKADNYSLWTCILRIKKAS